MSGHARLIALFLLCASAPLTIRSQSSSDLTGQLPAELVQMLRTQISWDQGLGRSGQHLRFVPFAPPSDPAHLSHFRIYAEGAAADTPYILGVWNIGTYVKDLQILSNHVYANRKGLLMTRKPKPDEEDSATVDSSAEYDVGVQAADGEPIRFILRSKDNTLLAPGTLIPFPVISTDHSCKLEARRSVPEDQAILISMDGFAPGSTLEIVSDSVGEKKTSQRSVNENGHAEFVELPFVTGKDHGTVHESITTKDCSVSIEIPWGKGSYVKH